MTKADRDTRLKLLHSSLDYLSTALGVLGETYAKTFGRDGLVHSPIDFITGAQQQIIASIRILEGTRPQDVGDDSPPPPPPADVVAAAGGRAVRAEPDFTRLADQMGLGGNWRMRRVQPIPEPPPFQEEEEERR